MGGFFQQAPQQDTNYDGFYDGQNKIVPDNSEFEFMVTDGFCGIEEGKSQQVCMINIVITTPGEFCGQKYRYNAKIFDMDASKRDLAMKNLGVLDAQAGFPMTNNELDLTTENIQDYWAGSAEARVKFGMFIDDEEGREINFVRGFAYLREKMRKPASQTTEQPAPKQAAPVYNEQPVNRPAPTQQQPADEPEIDF